MYDLRLAGTVGDRPIGARHNATAAVVSASSHAAFVLFALMLVRASAPVGGTPGAAVRDTSAKIVFFEDSRDGRGGGGSGNQRPQPSRAAERPGRDRTTVPVARSASVNLTPRRSEPTPVETLQIAAVSLAAGHDMLPGAIDGPPAPPTLSQGPGRGGISGTGIGRGIGPGEGDGLGFGRGGNTGGDVYRPGNGVSPPRLLKEVKPQYTADAMRAKVQGIVLVACVVRADGTITDVRVARSLDPTFGLDQQAVAAVRQWKFAPGTRMGEPVAVQIMVELTFTLR
jgi:protein TonB